MYQPVGIDQHPRDIYRRIHKNEDWKQQNIQQLHQGAGMPQSRKDVVGLPLINCCLQSAQHIQTVNVGFYVAFALTLKKGNAKNANNLIQSATVSLFLCLQHFNT